MMTRKQMKRLGRASLKQHYLFFVAACLIAAFLSAEFRSSLKLSSAQKYDTAGIQTQLEEDGSYTVTTERRHISWTEILGIIARDDTQAGKDASEEIRQNAIQHAREGNPMFGRTRGIFSHIINQVSSGSVFVTAVSAAASVTGSENGGLAALIILFAFAMGAFWFFVQNTFPVAVRRVFLEGMIYERVTTQRFLFLLRVRKWLKASWIMFVKYIFYMLWCFTIVGIVVKRYSYYMVPYIAAENPGMSARQALTLSRNMMKGHKWQCFVFELSFIGWELLGLATFGLVNILYTNPYKVASFTRYYAEIRREAIEKHVPGAELLWDTYLYEKAPESVLAGRYADVVSVMETEERQQEVMGGWRGVLANNFGILFLRREQERRFEKRQADYIRVYAMMDDVRREAYPVRLYPVPEEERRKLIQSLNYMRHYSVWSLITIFMTMSVMGWLWEVGMHLVSYGEFVNRGALHGPWLPIYGTGAVLILTVLYRFRANPALEFGMAVLLCGVLEYMTSFVMEIASGGTKWWDYSGYFLNLHGRICAEGLLVFGVGGLIIVYAIAPLIDIWISRFPERNIKIICSVAAVLFLADASYSSFVPNKGTGVTDIMEQVHVQEEQNIV